MWCSLSLEELFEVKNLPYPNGHDEDGVSQAPAVDHGWSKRFFHKCGSFWLRSNEITYQGLQSWLVLFADRTNPPLLVPGLGYVVSNLRFLSDWQGSSRMLRKGTYCFHRCVDSLWVFDKLCDSVVDDQLEYFVGVRSSFYFELPEDSFRFKHRVSKIWIGNVYQVFFLEAKTNLFMKQISKSPFSLASFPRSCPSTRLDEK